MRKTITNKRFRTLNAKSNQVGLSTREVLQVIDKMLKSDKMHDSWKNKEPCNK